MKRILAILMMVAMLFSFAAADDEAISFQPPLLNGMDFTAAEWWSSYTYKTAFAVIAAAELTDYTQQGIYDSCKEGILNNEIYVSIDESHSILTAFFFVHSFLLEIDIFNAHRLLQLFMVNGHAAFNIRIRISSIPSCFPSSPRPPLQTG